MSKFQCRCGNVITPHSDVNICGKCERAYDHNGTPLRYLLTLNRKDHMEPFKPHPNLSKEINDNIAKSEIDGGAWIEKLAVGRKLRVQTRNTLYTIERRDDGLYIDGNPLFCPTPTKCNIHGSTWGGSMLKIGFVGRGMYLEFSTKDHRLITTSQIKDVWET